MSERALEAYEGGERPLSRWSKADIIGAIAEAYGPEAAEKAASLPLAVLKERFLTCSSWHHTGKCFRKTDFYAFDGSLGDEALGKALEPAPKAARPAQPAAERWALVRYDRWERVPINRFGRLGWRKTCVVAVAHWKETAGKAGILECTRKPGGPVEWKKLSSVSVARPLPGKPRKNARVWKECGEEETR